EDEWKKIYRDAWDTFYSAEHMETVMRRAAATGIGAGKMLFLLLWFYGCISVERIHPLEGGFLRRKYRRDRRPTLPMETPLVCSPRYAAESVAKHIRLAHMIWRFGRIRRRLKRDPNVRAYTDQALTPVTETELDALEMFSATDAAKTAAEKVRKETRARVGA